MNNRLKSIGIAVFLLLLGTVTNAQVVNIESKRIKTDTIGTSGSLGTNFNMNKFGEKPVYTLGVRGHIQYKALRHIILLLGNSSFVRAAGDDFVNNGMLHLRYNYKIHPRISLEYYNQVQYNPVTKMQLRVLTGVGPRFKLSKSEKFRAYLGTSYMYEFEKIQEQLNPNKQHRSSSYLSFSLFPKNVSIVNTTYFQVKLDEWSDHRIVSQNSLAISITSAIAFTVGFDLIYDTEPNEDVPEIQYELRNGIKVSFN